MEEQEHLERQEERQDEPQKPKKSASKRSRFIKIVVPSAVAVLTAVTVLIFALSGSEESEHVSLLDRIYISDEPTAEELAAKKDAAEVKALGKLTVPDYVTEDYLGIGNARSGKRLSGIHNIVIHYIGNPGTTAGQNRHYFGLEETEVCSHFIIGLDGEIIQCLPLDERSAASNHRNTDTISIEVCHPDDSGVFNTATYHSLVKLCQWLCNNTELDADDLIRHHDITGKECPKYYVNHPDKWTEFKNDVAKGITKQ